MGWLRKFTETAPVRDSRRAAEGAFRIREASRKKAVIELQLLDIAAQRARLEQRAIDRLGNDSLFQQYGGVLIDYQEFAQNVDRGGRSAQREVAKLQAQANDVAGYVALKEFELEFAKALDEVLVQAKGLLDSIGAVQQHAYEFFRANGVNPMTLEHSEAPSI